MSLKEEYGKASLRDDYDKTNDKATYMSPLTSCMNKVVKNGYVDTYNVTADGLFSCKSEKQYKPEEVKVVNFYRFEGESDPADMSILYIIETADGGKGTLTDAYGVYADESVSKFIEQVPDVPKKEANSDNS